MFVRKRRNEVRAVQETTAMVSSDVLARYRLPVTECTRAAWANRPAHRAHIIMHGQRRTREAAGLFASKS